MFPGRYRACWTWAILGTACCLPAGAQTPLRWKLQPEETLRYQYLQRSQSQVTGAGKPTSVSLELSMHVAWRVGELDAQSIATVVQTIEQLSVSMQIDSLPAVSFDSSQRAPASGPGREIANRVGALLGRQFSVRLNDRGQVLDATGDPPAAEPPAREDAMVGSLLSPEGLKRVFQQSQLILPEEPLVAGTGWESRHEQSTPAGSLQVITRYEYAGREERSGVNCEKISSQARLTLQPALANLVPVRLVESEQTGASWFDQGAGRLRASELRQRLVTERLYGGMTMRVRSHSTLEVRLLPEAVP